MCFVTVIVYLFTMAKHAGSFLTQAFSYCRIDNWDDWKPTNLKTKWLLLSGSSDPPEVVKVSERRPRTTVTTKDGPFLDGVQKDFVNMNDALKKKGIELFNHMNILRITTSDAKNAINDVLVACKDERKKAVIYYTGHGEIGTGNWCFKDGTISLKELEDITPPGCLYPIIISDCCYSGNWADYCLYRDDIYCLAACPYFSTAVDIGEEGGELTCYLTNKLDPSKLTRTPVFSAIDDEHYPVSKTIESFDNLFEACLKKRTRSVKCHTIANGKLSAIFTKKESSSAIDWSCSSDFENFRKNFEEKWEEGKICSSFACDDNNFLTFFEEDGASQKYLYGHADHIQTEISKAWAKQMKITGCGAYRSSWIIIMTSGIPGSDIWTTRSTWRDCSAYIKKEQNEGYRLKGVCYNLGLQKYFLYMRNTSKAVMSKWFLEGQLKEAREWLMKYKHEYQVDFIFKDPTNNKTYIALEKTDVPCLDLDLAFHFSQQK